MFKDLLLLGLEHLKQQSAIAQDTELIMEDFDVREFNYPENLEAWDAVLITGSGTLFAFVLLHHCLVDSELGCFH
jgi:hypothetical protein